MSEILKPASVVMLDSEVKSDIQQFGISLRLRNNHVLPILGYYKHLYLTSTEDEEIKEGDWVYNSHRGLHKYEDGCIGECKKIVATTNPELWYSEYAKTKCPKCKGLMKVNLPDHCECINCGQKGWNLIQGVYNELQLNIPKIPTSFIETYVKEQGVIDKVNLEWEEYNRSTTWEYDEPEISKVKLIDNNTVIVHLIKERMYSREEVEAIAEKAFKAQFGTGKYGFETWMNKNYPI